MTVRKSAVAGRFYEAQPKKCLSQLQALIPRMLPAGTDTAGKTVKAGIVPHAGWVFSGDVAGKVFYQISQCQQVDTFIIFGAVHAVRTQRGLLYNTGAWETPLGQIEVDEELAGQILDTTGRWIDANTSGHQHEHSIEVEVPFIQQLFPQAKIVPIMLPPMAESAQIGKVVGRVLEAADKATVCIASTDLTHYGPSYGFSPMGVGPQANRWAREQNDRYFIDLALSLQADQIVETAAMYNNACGPGAVAATIAAACELGATEAALLAHTTSAEIMSEKFHQVAEDSVGYAGIVYY